MYLPLYVAGIIGPTAGGVVAAVIGPRGPFLLGGVVFAIGALAIARRQMRPAASGEVSEATADAVAIAEAEARTEAVEA